MYARYPPEIHQLPPRVVWSGCLFGRSVVILSARFRHSLCCWSVVTLTTPKSIRECLPFWLLNAAGVRSVQHGGRVGGGGLPNTLITGVASVFPSVSTSAPTHPQSLVLRLMLRGGLWLGNRQGGGTANGSPLLHLFTHVVVARPMVLSAPPASGTSVGSVMLALVARLMARLLGHLRPPRSAVPSFREVRTACQNGVPLWQAESY